MKTEESTLDKIRTRPRFKMITKMSSEEISESLKRYILLKKEEFNGNVNPEVATIEVKTKENPYWKPNLSIRTEQEDGETVVRGIFGPNSTVWTFFMFLYFLFGILWMVFFTMWFVTRQIGSDDFPWALTASFITLGLIGLVYLAARVGQKKSADQMQKLRQFAIDAILKFEK